MTRIAFLGLGIMGRAVASQVYQMAMSQGLGDKNVSAVIEALRTK